MRPFIIILFLAIAPALCAQEKTKLAVMDLKANSGIDEMKALTLTDVLCTEIAKLGYYKVISREDIKAMLMQVRDQQLLGCDDTRCLAEIGGALGVPLLVYGNIGMIGNTYVINLKLVDIDNADVVNRITEKYSGNESELINRMTTCVEKLFSKEKSMLANRAKPSKFRQFYTSSTVRYGLLIAGIITSTLAYENYSKGNDVYKNEYDQAVKNGDVAGEAQYWSQVRDYDKKANIFLGLTGFFFLGGGVSFAF